MAEASLPPPSLSWRYRFSPVLHKSRRPSI